MFLATPKTSDNEPSVSFSAGVVGTPAPPKRAPDFVKAMPDAFQNLDDMVHAEEFPDDALVRLPHLGQSPSQHLTPFRLQLIWCTPYRSL